MKKRRAFFTPLRTVISVLLVIAAAGAALGLYLQGKSIPVLNPQGVVGKEEKNLILFTLMLSVVVVVPVYIMLFVFAWRYREGNPKKTKYTPDVEGNPWIEGLWWGIPITIIGILCIVTWVSAHQLDPYRPLASNVKPLKVQVVALPWKWLFIYPDYHIASLNQLKIPAGVPVNFQITADAPMSAFWIPSLGTQVYAMPGMTSQLSLMADNAGEYRGSNSNINGKGYADMNFDVEALPSEESFYIWARTIVDSPNHFHLDDDEYAQLAKPGTLKDVAYYHLHDDNLYTMVMNKYMNGSMPVAMDMGGGNGKVGVNQ